MSEQTFTREQERSQQAPPSRLRHLYQPIEIVGRTPLRGDKALCGHVLAGSWGGRFLGDSPRSEMCVVCLDLWNGRA